MFQLLNVNTRTRWFRRAATVSVAGLAALAAFACSDRTKPSAAPTALTPSGPNFVISGYGGAAGFTFDVNGAQWTSGFDVATSVGTGVIRPFLDLEAQGKNTTEAGFNTDNDAFVYDQHRTTATNALPLNYVPVFSGPAPYGHVREFVLDAHESDNYFNIDEFEVYLCFSDAARTYSTKSQVTSNCSIVYNIAGASPAPPINATDQFSSGSGNVFDYRILIPNSKFQDAATAHAAGTQLCEYDPSAAAEANCHQYIIVWSNLSDVDATFEEFSTILRPAVRITKTPDAGTVDAGNDITFTMVVTSSGGTSTAVTLSDPLPAGVTWYTSTTTAGSCSITGAPQTLNCNLGDIAAGATVTITVSAHTTQSSCAVYNNTATVTSTSGGDDSDNGDITVQNCHGTLVIEKITNGGVGTFTYTTTGTGLSGFTLTPSAPGAAGKDSKSFNLLAGSYSVTESGPPTGWEFTSLSCTTGGSVTSQTANITLAAGATVTCTYTNTKQGNIVIEKVTNGGFGGPFPYTTTGTGLSSFNLTTTAAGTAGKDSKTFSNLSPGSYSVTEGTLPAGWEFTSLSCTTGGSVSTQTANITLVAGATVTCTYTNTKQATIVIEKVTNGSGGGPFPYTTTGTGLSSFNLSTAGAGAANKATKTFTNLSPGSYSVTEGTLPTGWEFTSLSCTTGGSVSSQTANITLVAGALVTCTYTNTKQGNIVIEKVTNGGYGVAFPYSTTGTGLSSFNLTTTGTGTGGKATKTFSNLSPGSYSVTEGTLPAGWQFTSLSCTTGGSVSTQTANITLVAGATVTCTYTNTKLPTLTIIKYLKGTSTGFDFSSTGGLSPSTFTLTPPGIGCTAPAGSTCDQVTYQNLTVGGTYTITEGAKSGYVLTDLNCTLHPGTYDPTVTRTVSTTLAAGENETCAFYNEEVVGSTTRTQGFWATHSGLLNAVWFGGSSGGHTYPTPDAAKTQICFDPNPHNLTLTTLGEVLGGFWAGVSQTSTKAKRSDLDQARMQLLQQLLAAIANNLAFSSVPSGAISIADAKAAFCGTDIDAIKAAMSAMAAFNTSGDNGLFTPGASANGKVAKGLADISFWDTLIP